MSTSAGSTRIPSGRSRSCLTAVSEGRSSQIACRGKMQRAHRVDIARRLRLPARIVAPHHWSEPPRRGKLRVAGEIVVVTREIDRAIGREEVERETARRARSHAEGRAHAMGDGRSDIEDAGVRLVDEEAPSARAEEERHRHVGLVVLALDVRIELELHRADLPALIDRIVLLAKAVESFGIVDDRPEAHVRDALRAAGHEVEVEPLLRADLHVEERRPIGIDEPHRDVVDLFARELGASAPPTREIALGLVEWGAERRAGKGSVARRVVGRRSRCRGRASVRIERGRRRLAATPHERARCAPALR